MISKLREKVRKSSVIAMLFFTTFITALILSFNVVADIDAFKIVGAEVSARDTGVSGTVTDYDADSVESDTVFHHVGDTITYTLTVNNQHDKDYKIITISDNNSNESVSYNYDKHVGEKVAAGASFNLIVEVEYVSSVASLNDRNQHLAVDFVITYEEYTEPEPTPGPDEGGETPIAPDTGFNTTDGGSSNHLPIYMIVLAVSAVGVIVCVWRAGNSRDRKKNYNGRKIIVCLLVASALIPVAAKALTESSDFTITTDYAFMDKLAITIDVDGTESVVSANYGSTVGSLQTPSKDNYNFVGWKDEGDNILPDNTELTEGMKLTAEFEPIMARVTFDTHSDTTINPVDVQVGNTITLPADPSKQNHIFDGWWTAAEGGDSFTNATIVNADITIHAHWIANINTLDFDVNKTNLKYDINKEKTETIGVTPSSTYPVEEYDFVSSDTSVATVDANGLITAIGEGTATITAVSRTDSSRVVTIATVTVARGMRTVTYNTHGGSAVTADEVVAGQTVSTLPTTELENHIFDGWWTAAEGGDSFTDTTVVNEDITVHAHWIANINTLEFNVNKTTLNYDIEEEKTETIGVTPTSTYPVEEYDFVSSDTSVATIDTNGLITAAGEGTATITAISRADSSRVVTIATITVVRIPIICKAATTLHEVTCTNGGCKTVDNKQDEQIVYGQLPDQGSPKVGDAYDCDVNNDGTFDAEHERFYYLSGNATTASLIFYSGYQGPEGAKNELIYYYSEIEEMLPSRSSQWTNPYIGTIRIPTKAEVEEESCGRNGNKLVGCRFMLEGTRYESTTTGRTAIWLQKVETDPKYDRINTSNVEFEQKSASENSRNSVRPVMEIPLAAVQKTYLIEYEVGTGTFITGERYQQITRGEAITDLPTFDKTDYIDEGWWTSADGGTKLETGHVPASDEKYYAHYSKSIALADITNPNITIDVGESAQINIANAAEIGEPYTFSIDSGNASVDEDGLVIGNAVGSATIMILGTISGATKTVHVNVIEPRNYYIVSFEVDGGDPVNPINVDKNSAIGTAVSALPTTTKANNTFTYWYADASRTTRVTLDTIVDSDVTYYAWWVPTDTVAIIDGVGYYTDPGAAFDAVPIDGTKTTITMIDDYSGFTDRSNEAADATKNIVLDLNGHTISSTGTTGKNVIRSNSTLEIKNGTITSNVSSGAVENCPGRTLTLSDVRIDMTKDRQAVYNNGGTLYIKGNSVITSSARIRAAVHNLNNGTMVITDGAISSVRIAVFNESGTLTIGQKNGSIDASKPLITGETYGVVVYSVENTTYNIYDGTIRGKTYPVGIASTITNREPIVPSDDTGKDLDDSKIDDKEVDSEVAKEDKDGYKILYLQRTSGRIYLYFDGNGGTSSEEMRAVDAGDTMGELPTASRPHYGFLGWFTDPDNGEEIDENTQVPDVDTHYYAHWQAQSSDEIVNFNIQSDAVQDYFTNIASWNTTGVNTALWTELKSNFDGHDCKYNSNPDLSNDWKSGGARYGYKYDENGTVYCDRPAAYSTGITDGIKVYLSNDSKTKLDEVSYLNTANGDISNMIPGTIYRWESSNDANVYGYVRAVGERRIIELPSTRNVRDLGGLTGMDGKTIKYGRLIRGEYLQTDDDVAELRKLGMNKEYDLRDTDINGKHFSDTVADYKFPVVHYNFDYDTSGYNTTRAAFKSLMQDVVDGKNVYFHCTHGADRTGTIAWLAESILGVDDETINRDYELTSFSGRPDRNRYYDNKNGVTEKYTFMKGWMSNYTNAAYDWYMADPSADASDEALITAFRNAMLE